MKLNGESDGRGPSNSSVPPLFELRAVSQQNFHLPHRTTNHSISYTSHAYTSMLLQELPLKIFNHVSKAIAGTVGIKKMECSAAAPRFAPPIAMKEFDYVGGNDTPKTLAFKV